MSLNRRTPTWPSPDVGQTPLGEARSVVTLCLPDPLKHTLPRHILAPAAEVRHLGVPDIPSLQVQGPSAPDLILSPLSAPGFDVLDFAATLQQFGFSGRYLVLAPAEMPDIPLIRSELASASTALNIDIVALGNDSALHVV